MTQEVRDRYRRLLDRIGEATLRSGRPPGTVRLIGVTKRVGTDRIREAIENGLKEIGENRIQEAEEKLPQLSDTGVVCHMIGHLQSNKAAAAVGLFSSIQSVDSVSLARRLDRLTTHRLGILLQLHLGDETTKSGLDPTRLGAVIGEVRSLSNLELRGLMAIPPFEEDPEQVRPYFAKLRQLADDYELDDVSMGMSHDFEVAIEEGATMVRLGTALFGTRA
jgi:pyridoxal phosphate enzyme (YggS family)